MSTDSIRKRAANGAGWMTLEMLGIQATLFGVFVAISHFVEPRDFGLINISYLSVQMLQMLVLYNVDTAVARKKAAPDIAYTTAFWIGMGISFVGFLGLLIASFFVDKVFNAPGLAPVFRAMSIIILFMALGRVHETWMLRHFRYKSLAVRGLVGAAASAAVGITMAVKGFGVMALVGQQVTNAVVTMALLWITCSWRPSFAFSRSVAAEIFHFMRSTVPNSLVYALNQNCDTFLIALVFGPASAGIYNVAKRLRLMLQLVMGAPINSISLASLAEIQNEPQRLRVGILNLLMLICLIASPVFFGASAVSYEIIGVVFGTKWAAAAPVLELLSLSGFALVVLAYGDVIFALKKRQQMSLYISISYTALALLIFAICRLMHIDSIALAFVLPYLVIFPLAAVLVSKCAALPLRDWVRAMLPGLSSSVVMMGIVKLVGSQLAGVSDLQRLVILCAVGGVAYVAILGIAWRASTRVLFDTARQVFHR